MFSLVMHKVHPKLEPLLAASGALAEAAALAARSTQRQLLRSLRPRRGQTLRPGIDTPLWNTLVEAVRPHLKKRGDKVNLGRFLGLPRQRIHEFLNNRSTLPDAERTLLLLCWLEAKRQGKSL
jgi:hypothetical protein